MKKINACENGLQKFGKYTSVEKAIREARAEWIEWADLKVNGYTENRTKFLLMAVMTISNHLSPDGKRALDMLIFEPDVSKIDRGAYMSLINNEQDERLKKILTDLVSTLHGDDSIIRPHVHLVKQIRRFDPSVYSTIYMIQRDTILSQLKKKANTMVNQEIFERHVSNAEGVYGVTRERLFRKNRKRVLSRTRQLVMYLCYMSGVPPHEIQNFFVVNGFECTQQNINHAVAVWENLYNEIPEYKKMIDRWLSEI